MDLTNDADLTGVINKDKVLPNVQCIQTEGDLSSSDETQKSFVSDVNSIRMRESLISVSVQRGAAEMLPLLST